MGSSQNWAWDNYASEGSWDASNCNIKLPTFSSGRMKVQNASGLWGYIDATGKVLGMVKWDSIDAFEDGMAIVSSNNLYGFINEQGRQIGQVRWTQIRSFSNGYAAVKDSAGKWGFINKKNDLVIPCRYTEVASFRDDGTCDVKTVQGTWVIIDTTGQTVFFGN